MDPSTRPRGHRDVADRSRSRGADEQRRIDRTLAGVLRALSGDSDLDRWGARPIDTHGRLPLNAPHLYPSLADAGLSSLRGAADAMALRMRHSDLGDHRSALPDSTAERLVVEVLEQFRCEALADLPGVRQNLAQRHTEWCREFLGSRLHETHQGILLLTITVVARSTLTGEPISEDCVDLIEATRADLAADMGELLVRLRRTRTSQSAFLPAALDFAAFVAARMAENEEQWGQGTRPRRRGTASAFSLVLDVSESPFAAPGGSPESPGSAGRGYAIWDASFDSTRHICDVVRPAQLRDLRRQLDEQTQDRRAPVAPIISRLQPVVAAPVEVCDLEDGESGVLDPRRLSRLITSPGERRVFRDVTTTGQPDTAVTFLLDCSGSMKPHAAGLAALLDGLVTALDRLDVVTEVLGFTTGAWNGGRPKRSWQRSGSPAGIGRLNEVDHLVFKDSATTARRARFALAGLLKLSLYREGVDGEAVRWALTRLDRVDAARTVLVVVSDGSPADGATAEANDEDYLARDLAATIAAAARPDRHLIGVGLGCDVSDFYQSAIALEPETLGDRASTRAVVEALRTALGRHGGHV
ncbi:MULTISPECIES: cobalt chelatase [Brevibacterium]|uniref:Cobalt chelatase n=1 Tax=Brevibacterium casei TaxID=33889 RepID=A0A7T3ZWQ9_9MICO|nr:cobalt chelatase [Brevibacterium casei]QQB13076.1 cobalt chelatase [Brevibacterium casei]